MRPRHLNGLRLAVVGCLVGCAVPSGVLAQAKTIGNPVAPEVRKLVLRGVNSVDEVDLEKSIATSASECKSLAVAMFCLFSRSETFVQREYLDRKELARDLLRIRVYYWKRGFRATEVDTIVTRTGDKQVTVTFDIVEHEPTLIRKIRIDYDSTLLRERRVQRLTLLKAGQPLDLVKLDSMRVLFANEMWAEGHGDATVDTALTIDTQRRVADVHLMLIPGQPTFVGEIVVVGLEKVSRASVLNSITLKPGEPYRQGDVLASQRNLFESNLFRLAAVEVPPQFDSMKKVTITVAESPLHDAHAAAGLTNIEFFQTEAKYTSYNLLGGARRLDVTTTVGNLLANQLAGRGFFYDPADNIIGADAGKYLQPTWAASVDLRQPAFLRRPSNSAGVSAFAHRRSTPGIFIDRGFGGAATLTNRVRVRAPVSLTYRFEVNRVDATDVYFCINFGVCEAPTIDALRARQRLSPLSLTGFIDRSDDPLDPTRGYLARVDLEHASSLSLSDYGYNRAYLDVAAYNHRGPTAVYAGHLRLGFVRQGGGSENVLHPRKLLYSGGASSVRGYATNQLGPRVLTIAPEKLVAAGCDATSLSTTCDPNTANIPDKEFNPQPLGGTSLIEASVEYRVPIAMRRKLTAAVFLDGAIVGSGFVPSFATIRNITKGSGAITPGAGIRYKSPVGPIRVDVGFNPARTEQLQVITEAVVNGGRRIVTLSNLRDYTSARSLLDRFTLHFSIGQAY